MVHEDRWKDIWAIGHAVAMRTIKQRILDYLLLIALLGTALLVLMSKASIW